MFHDMEGNVGHWYLFVVDSIKRKAFVLDSLKLRGDTQRVKDCKKMVRICYDKCYLYEWYFGLYLQLELQIESQKHLFLQLQFLNKLIQHPSFESRFLFAKPNFEAFPIEVLDVRQQANTLVNPTHLLART